ncbi:MAG: TonB-dependent receptor [Bacteroidota bacterium]
MFLKKSFKNLLKKSRQVLPGFFVCANLVFFLFILSFLKAASQTKDTVFTTKSVIVTADKTTDKAASSLVPITIISQEELEQTGAWQISDALSFAPGIFIKNYGGLGGLKTVSLRGTTASQTAILLNGVRLNSTQNGQFDLSALPSSLVEEIEVTRGGASMLYGGNAVGGAVNILTNSFKNESFFKTNLQYGSFKSSLISANGGWQISDSLGVSALGEYSQSAGDYPFHSNQFGENVVLKRENGDFKNLSGLITGKFPFKSWQFAAQTLARKTERGTPGAVVQGRVESANARLDENDVLFSLNSFKDISENASLDVLLSSKFNNLNYRDPDAMFSGNNGESLFKSRDLTARTSSKIFFKNWLADVFAEGGFADLRGDNLQPGVGEYVKRATVSTGLRGEHEIEIDSLLKVTLHGGLRFDYFSDAGNAFSPLLGAAISPFKNLTFRTQWSYNFRPPSFTEMYYLNYGNSLLKPEKSHSFNLGAAWQPVLKTLLEAEFFLIRTNDQIAGVPKNPVQWSAKNIGLVITRGVEVSVLLKPFDEFSLRGNYTFQKATDESPESYSKGKQVVYTPQHLASAVMNYGFFKSGSFKSSAGMQAQFSGERYSLPDNSVESRLPEFITLDAHFVQEILFKNFSLKLRAEALNIFDAQYAVIRNYPMPGRSFRLGVSGEL